VLTLKRARAGLARGCSARRRPHWHRVSKGCQLGFRHMTREAHGTWLARSLDAATGK